MDNPKTLYHNRWLSLKEIDGYVFSHEERCEGHIVAVLPFRYNDGHDAREFLIRDEWNIAWGGINVASITGGMDHGDETPETCAVRETEEEAGYIVPDHEYQKRVIDLGMMRGAKSSDTVYHLFAIDVTGLDRGEAKGDGSADELKSSCRWSPGIPNETQDPFLYALFQRLQEKSSKESI